MPKDGSVQFENLTNSIGVLVVSGPKARELMKRVSKDDFSNENFKWLSSKNVNIGHAPVNAMRVNYYLVETNEDADRISVAFEEAKKTNRPVAILVGDEYHGFNRV